MPVVFSKLFFSLILHEDFLLNIRLLLLWNMHEKVNKITHTNIYIYIYGEMLDFGESDKMIKKNEVDKSNTYNGFSSNI